MKNRRLRSVEWECHQILCRIADRTRRQGNSMEILDKIEARISIVGLGYVGLPLAVAFAEAGFRVTGIETNPERVQEINLCVSYAPDGPD